MKKFLMPLVAFAAFLFVACSSPTPTDEAIDLMEEATEKIEKAQTLDEFQAVSEEMETKFAEMEKKYPDYEPTAEDKQRVEDAMNKFQEVCQKKATEFVGAMLGDGDDSGEEEE